MTPCPVCGHDMRDACAPCAERAALVESRRDDLRKRLDEQPTGRSPWWPRSDIAQCDCDECASGHTEMWRAWCECGWRIQGSQSLPTQGDAADAVNAHRESHRPWRDFYDGEVFVGRGGAGNACLASVAGAPLHDRPADGVSGAAVVNVEPYTGGGGWLA